jgi:hypothetical protein
MKQRPNCGVLNDNSFVTGTKGQMYCKTGGWQIFRPPCDVVFVTKYVAFLEENCISLSQRLLLLLIIIVLKKSHILCYQFCEFSLRIATYEKRLHTKEKIAIREQKNANVYVCET